MSFPLESFAAGFTAVSPDIEADLPPTAPTSSFDSSRLTLKIDIKFGVTATQILFLKKRGGDKPFAQLIIMLKQ